MAFGKKEKKNPSSRYARIEEPWLDDENVPEKEEPWSEIPQDGYGVRDSLSRQASYGRPEGYFEQDYYPEDSQAEADGYGRYGNEYEQGRRYKSSGGGYGDEYEQGRRYESSGGGYGDEYEQGRRYESSGGGYGDEYEQGRRYESSGGGYGRDDDDPYGYGRDYDEPGAYSRGGKRKKTPRAEEGAAVVKKRSKAGFIVKLILLLIAAVVLICVWRFSRLKHVSLSDIITNAGVEPVSGYREFVIYGVDSREGNLTQDAHSDTIILCSMNQSTKEIRMVSVYRDTYLDNTNGEYRKATECYFFGGPSRSVNMLNKNLDLNLHDYITVDFNAVVKAVDLIGGVDVEVTEEELPYINGYQTENAEVTGAAITPVESAGYQHLNGIQALAYCRIRYTAGSDYRRTERQRTVLSQIFEKAKSQGPVKMAQIVDSMLPYIATSFSSAELLDLVSSISGSSLLDSVGFPFDLQAANIAAGDCVVPVNLAQNVSKLHAYLYQQNDYTPSQTVQEISNEIANTTGII